MNLHYLESNKIWTTRKSKTLITFDNTYFKQPLKSTNDNIKCCCEVDRISMISPYLVFTP